MYRMSRLADNGHVASPSGLLGSVMMRHIQVLFL